VTASIIASSSVASNSVVSNSVAPKQAARVALLERILNPLPDFKLNASQSEPAQVVCDYVRERYLTSYDAEVKHFLPWLLSMECLGHQSGVAGLQPAQQSTQQSPLFLEQYLALPVESLLAAKTGEPVQRRSIVEVGNLVAGRKGASHLLFLMFTATLQAAGYEWIVFTATRGLRNNLNKLGFPLVELQAVDVAGLAPDVREEWGSYYSTEPKVMAGRLQDAAALINSRALYRKIARVYRPTIQALAATLRTGDATDVA
jgi:hypothetical protein